MCAILTWRLEIAFGRKNMTCKTPTGWAFYHTRGVRGPFATFCKMFKCGRFVASYLILWVGISAKMFEVHYTGRKRLSISISFKITPAKLKGGGGFLHHSPLNLSWRKFQTSISSTLRNFF